MASETRLPLFPLADVVHFPRTELRLQVSEPRYLRLVEDLAAREDEEALWVGVVLLKPGWVQSYEGRPPIFPGGTAGRLLDIEMLPDGKTANIHLYGDFRFQLEREVGDEPYRQAVVKPIEEPWLNEQDAGIVSVRRAILDHVRTLSSELGESFPLEPGAVAELGDDSPPFEELVNRLAFELDIPVLRKLQLLTESVPERGLSVLSILRHRAQVVDLLRPYRHLANRSELN